MHNISGAKTQRNKEEGFFAFLKKTRASDIKVGVSLCIDIYELMCMQAGIKDDFFSPFSASDQAR